MLKKNKRTYSFGTHSGTLLKRFKSLQLCTKFILFTRDLRLEFSSKNTTMLNVIEENSKILLSALAHRRYPFTQETDGVRKEANGDVESL